MSAVVYVGEVFLTVTREEVASSGWDTEPADPQAATMATDVDDGIMDKFADTGATDTVREGVTVADMDET